MNIGIEIGGTKLQIAIGYPETGKIETLFRFDVEKDKGATGILDKIEVTLNQLSQRPASIGVGFGGPINRKTGIIATSHQIGGWSGFDLKNWLLERYPLESLAIDNDANTAALGEAWFGAGRGFEQQFYVTLGSGVGGGMVVNKHLYHGNAPGEAEIGLLFLDKSGNTLESFCSGWALDAKIRAVISQLPADSILKRMIETSQTAEAKSLLPALQQGDHAALGIFQEYADNLAWGLSQVVHLFNPQVIVLGGGVSLLGSPLAAAVQQALPRYLAKVYQPGPVVRISELSEEVVLVGALCLLHQKNKGRNEQP